MINVILEIITSKEIIIFTVMLIILFIIINPNTKLLNRKIKNRKNYKKDSNNELLSKSEKPGKIIVPNSTYEILKKEKDKRR